MDKQIYQKKYLKYKIKYLKLLNPNVQIPRNILKIYYGGASIDDIKTKKDTILTELLDNIVTNSFTFNIYEIYIHKMNKLIEELNRIKNDTNKDDIANLIKSYETDIFKLDYKKDYQNYNFLSYIQQRYPAFTIEDFFNFGFQQIIIEIHKLSILNNSKKTNRWVECTQDCNKKIIKTIYDNCNNKCKKCNDCTKKCEECNNNCSQCKKCTIDCTSNNCNACNYFKDCNKCYDILRDLIMLETESTAYMIRALKHSIITIIGKTTIDISPTIGQFTGKWIEDQSKFTITDANRTHKLIFGYGPSASGKTYCANTIIKILSKIDPTKTFPTSFMSIDGGPCREASIFYNFIVKCVLSYSLDGISNLDKNTLATKVGATKVGLGRGSLFPKVKKVLQVFLQNKQNISLYIPTTSSIDKNDLEKYISITNDNDWIALLIWQHKTDIKCVYNDSFLKCKGCYKSGTEREKDEGKIYDRKQKQWVRSMDIGTSQLKIAPGGGYSIHNSGRRGGDLMIIDWKSPAFTSEYNTKSNSIDFTINKNIPLIFTFKEGNCFKFNTEDKKINGHANKSEYIYRIKKCIQNIELIYTNTTINKEYKLSLNENNLDIINIIKMIDCDTTIPTITITTPKRPFKSVVTNMIIVNKFIGKQNKITSDNLSSNVMFIELYKIQFDKNKIWYEDSSIIKTKLGIDEINCKKNQYYNENYVYGCNLPLSKFSGFKILKELRPTIFNVRPTYKLNEEITSNSKDIVDSSTATA
jgi:hypothetical protein